MPDQAQNKRICFIINPASGTTKSKEISDLINAEIDSGSFDVDIRYTDSAGHAEKLCKQALESGYEIIVAVGGDGTINEVASQMINSNAVLGIIPRGSGNGLARHLGIPLQVNKAIKLINAGKHIKIDTATVNDKSFISIAGIGFDALVAKFFERSKKRGFNTYFKIIATKFKTYKPKKYKLLFDNGHLLETRAFFISFANSNQFGYNTTIAPNAKLDDGLLDVCIVKKPGVFELPQIANLVLRKRIDKSNIIDIIQTTGVMVKRNKNRTVNVDGESLKLGKKLKIKVNPLSLNIIIP